MARGNFADELIDLRRTGREAGLFFIAAFPLLADWFYRVVIHLRPFWVYYYDGEVAYFYRGLHYNSPYAPRLVEHPGVPLQWISAAIVQFTGRSLLHIDTMRTAGYTVALGLSLLGLLLLRRTLFRDAGPWMWCVGGWITYLAPAALKFSVIWGADILFMPLSALALAAVWRVDDRDRSLDWLGAAIGLAIATKLVFLAWLGGAGVMLLTEARPWHERIQRAIRLSVVSALSFLCIAATFGSRFISLGGWLWKLVVHGNDYISTAQSAPTSLLQKGKNVFTSLSQAPAWLLVAAAVVLVLLLTSRFTEVDRARLTFLLASMACSVILGIRQPYADFHYFLPMPFASIGLVALLSAHSSARMRVIVAAAAAPLMMLGLNDGIRSHDAEIADQTALRAAVDRAVHRIAPHGVVIYSWHLPEPSLALKAVTTDPDVFHEVSRVYPNEGHWVPWRDRVFLPVGAKRWDIAVVDEGDLPSFPEPVGATIEQVGDYRIVAGPTRATAGPTRATARPMRATPPAPPSASPRPGPPHGERSTPPR